MEQENRVREIRRRFEDLNSLNDSHNSSKRLFDGNQETGRTGRKLSDSDSNSSVKGGIKRSHAFRSDKSKVKPPIAKSASFGDEKEGFKASKPALKGVELHVRERSVNTNVLKPPNILTKPRSGLTNAINKPNDLSDTLKKALNNPLPPGPAPRKPPRTFAHPGGSFELEDSSTVRSLIDKVENRNGIERNDKPLVLPPQRSKTEPHIMLKKIESALLNSQSKVIIPKNQQKSYLTNSKISPNAVKNTFANKGSLCLNGLSCVNRNIYETPFECINKSLFNEEKEKLTTLPPSIPLYGKIQKKIESPHIYEEPYSPRAERKFDSIRSSEKSLRSVLPKPSLHYASTPICETARLRSQDVIIPLTPLLSRNTKIKMITEAFDNTKSDSDADSIQEDKNGNYEEVTAARKIYAQRVYSMRRQTSYVVKRNNLFEAILLVGLDQDINLGKLPYIKSKYPQSVELPKEIGRLVFPDAGDWPPPTTSPSRHNNYTLTLTADDGSRKYTYCRRLQPEGTHCCLPLAYAIVSSHRDNMFFYSILAELELRHGLPESEYLEYVKTLYHSTFPKPGTNLKVGDVLIRRALDQRKESHEITTMLHSVSVPVFIKIFSTLLIERKVILIGSNISFLSDCIEGLQKGLFPFEWMHTLVGAVPSDMLDFCTAVTPFLMGVVRPKASPHSASFLPLSHIEDCLVADVDSGKILLSCGDEATLLPSRLASCLKSALTLCHQRASDVGPSEAIIRLFVELIGHYNSFIVTDVHTNKRTFQREAFVKSPKSRDVQSFLEWFSLTAMFQSFIQSRLDRSQPGLFEQRCAEYIEENVKNNMSKKEKSLNKTVKIIGDKFKDWAYS